MPKKLQILGKDMQTTIKLHPKKQGRNEATKQQIDETHVTDIIRNNL